MIPEWRYPKNCRICKKAFMPRQPNQVCCCRECSDENARRYAMEKRMNTPEDQKPKRKRKRKEKVVSIEEINKRAREQGMSYGKYVAWEEMNRKKLT